uniref:Putative sensor domain-containing protein n=1 Tax=Candidatus Methanogaster sp. ANME-2c ERB4 TaxID=2759911 RepID=A0A7G9YH70_9EURY|nr:hypothetical protein LNGCCOLK_00031 [Methanosarcinales archaeon ANME-2c ERB4]
MIYHEKIQLYRAWNVYWKRNWSNCICHHGQCVIFHSYGIWDNPRVGNRKLAGQAKEAMNMNETTGIVKQFFGVAARGQTYLNIIYLLLSFPLGTAYFVFLVTGLLLGLSLSIVWVGIPILLLMLAAWWGLVVFERQLAIWLLHVDIPPMSRETTSGQAHGCGSNVT